MSTKDEDRDREAIRPPRWLESLSCTKVRLSLSLLSGGLLALSLPPFDIWPVAFVGLLPILFVIDGLGAESKHGKGLRVPFYYSYLFGISYFLLTLYWVVYPMYIYGGVPFGLSIVGMIIFVLYMSIYPGLFGLFISFSLQFGSSLSRNGSVISSGYGLVVVPSLWVGLEYLRGTALTGFPWALIGYSQVGNLTLLQSADIGGIWGISFWVLLANLLIFRAIKEVVRYSGRGLVVNLSLLALLLTTVTSYGLIRSRNLASEFSGWTDQTFVVVQGNISQDQKWLQENRSKTIEKYRELSLVGIKGSKGGLGGQGKRAMGESDHYPLIVWPETAMPFFLEHGTASGERAKGVVRELGGFVLTGAPFAEKVSIGDGGGDDGGSEVRYYNSAYLLEPDGNIGGRYDKVHLVPFGEYVPFKKLLFFIDKFVEGIGDFSPGTSFNPLPINGNGLGTLICYEAIFPNIARGQVVDGATMLVNITNDAWFGPTSAPHQHLSISLVRAVEGRVPLIRAANTGISALIDPLGRVVSEGGLFTEEVLGGTLPVRPLYGEVLSGNGDEGGSAGNSAATLYLRFGDYIPYLSLLISGIFIAAAILGRRRQKSI